VAQTATLWVPRIPFRPQISHFGLSGQSFGSAHPVGRGLSVDDCVAALSRRVQDAHRSETEGHLLGEAAFDRGGVGELGRVEQRGQVPRKQAGCIVWAGNADALLDRDESAPDDNPAAAPERTAVAVDAQLVLVGKEQLELELRLAEQRGNADQSAEDVLDASPPRRASDRERFALLAEPDDPADKRHRCNQA